MKSHHIYNFWIQKCHCPFSQFLDPDKNCFIFIIFDLQTARFLPFLDPEIAPYSERFLYKLQWDSLCFECLKCRMKCKMRRLHNVNYSLLSIQVLNYQTKNWKKSCWCNTWTLPSSFFIVGSMFLVWQLLSFLDCIDISLVALLLHTPRSQVGVWHVATSVLYCGALICSALFFLLLAFLSLWWHVMSYVHFPLMCWLSSGVHVYTTLFRWCDMCWLSHGGGILMKCFYVILFLLTLLWGCGR